MRVHEVKIHEHFLALIWEGKKTAELRRDDRAYQLGDHVVLREWSEEKRWGPRFVVIEVTHVYSASYVSVFVYKKRAWAPRGRWAPSD